MKKAGCNIILLGILSFSLNAQLSLPDSLKFKAEEDPDFLELCYETKYYANGIIEYEGWAYIIPFPEQERLAIFRIGNWKMYNKDGTIAREEFVPYDRSNSTISTQYSEGYKYFELFFSQEKNWDRFDNLNYSKFYGTGTLPTNFCAKSYYSYGKHRGKLKRDFCKTSLSKKDGNYFEYYTNGNKKEERHYDNGVKVGEWKWFNKDGSLKKSKSYD